MDEAEQYSAQHVRKQSPPVQPRYADEPGTSAYQSNDNNTQHLLDWSEQFSCSAFFLTNGNKEQRSNQQKFPLEQAYEVCLAHLLVQRQQRAASGFRLRQGGLSMKCNSRNDDQQVFETHSIIASHQGCTSFLDVTISFAVEKKGGAGTVTLSPQRRQKN